MKLLSRKDAKAAPTKGAQKTTSKTPVKTSAWTNGSALGAKAVSIIALLAVTCGPVALVAVFIKPSARPATVASTAQEPLSALQQSAGAFGLGLVGAWLSSSKSDSSALAAYINTEPSQLGEKPYDSRNLSVAQIEPAKGEDLVDVLVGADIYEQPATASQPSWIRRYFEVTVSTVGGKLSALGLPAPKAGPDVQPTQKGLGFSNQMLTSSPAAETADLFLTAYLTGQGSTSSYLTPGVNIAPISPAPYRSLTPVSLYADRTPAATPTDGDLLHVQVTVALANGNGQSVTATYWVHLTARAGRWEVTDLEANSSVDSASNSPTSTPTSAPAPTQESTEGATP
ncbi:conjugal transfer protein [Microbacterium testaceum]|uniref:conjugal transfer protein n=1 Tax=Microbacterium testaceum TaxID=2033 RepID=UPI002AC7D4DE|nr:conjugal transfer protein [Microbacterium testaceum]MDZ5146356.1 conjugal transfer protein [Microbacterium testaceum]